MHIQAGAKRKVSTLQESTAALLANAEQRAKKIAKMAEKLPEVAKLLQPFV